MVLPWHSVRTDALSYAKSPAKNGVFAVACMDEDFIDQSYMQQPRQLLYAKSPVARLHLFGAHTSSSSNWAGTHAEQALSRRQDGLDLSFWLSTSGLACHLWFFFTAPTIWLSSEQTAEEHLPSAFQGCLRCGRLPQSTPSATPTDRALDEAGRDREEARPPGIHRQCRSPHCSSHAGFGGDQSRVAAVG